MHCIDNPHKYADASSDIEDSQLFSKIRSQSVLEIATSAHAMLAGCYSQGRARTHGGEGTTVVHEDALADRPSN